MASQPNTGAASVLQFPQRNKGRVRKTQSIEAAGDLALMLMDRDGEKFPANVARLCVADSEPLPSRSPELLLGLLMFAQLPTARRNAVRSAVRCAAYGGTASAAVATQLHNALRDLS